MTTSEGALTVIGELRSIVEAHKNEIIALDKVNFELVNEVRALKLEINRLDVELSHTRNSLRNATKDKMRDTIA